MKVVLERKRERRGREKKKKKKERGEKDEEWRGWLSGQLIITLFVLLSRPSSSSTWGKSTRDELLSKLEHLLIPGRNPSSIISARLARVARVALYRDVF